MADYSFWVGDGSSEPRVRIEITDLGGGAFRFDLSQDTTEGFLVGDLFGLFFNVGGDGATNLTAADGVTTDITSYLFDLDDVVSLGGGNTVSPNGPYDFGLTIGVSGLQGGADDNQTASFTVSGADLELADFIGQEFAVRLQSVGTVDYVQDGVVHFVDGARGGSAKVTGNGGDNPPPPPDNHFNPTPKDISYVTLYFDLNDNGAIEAADLVVKIDNVATAASDDLDLWYQAVTNYLTFNGHIEASDDLLAATIKYGSTKSGGGSFFFMLDGNPNDVDVYSEIGLTGEVTGKAIDLVVQYSTLVNEGWIA